MRSIVDSTFINKYKPYYINDFYISDKLKTTLHTLIEIDNLNFHAEIRLDTPSSHHVKKNG